MHSSSPGRARRGPAVVAVACMVALGACDGENLFTGPSVTADILRPNVTILEPTGDSVTTHTIGDSLSVTVTVTDLGGVDSISIEGFAIRGNVDTGANEIIPRYETALLILETAPSDTTVTQILAATEDGFVETAQIVATAWDRAGNSRADTVSVFLDVPLLIVLQRQAADPARPRGDGTVVQR